MDTSRSKSSSNVSDLQGLREREDGNKNHIPRSHSMNTSRSKSSSNSNDLHGQREREEQGNMNRLPRSHQSSHVGLPSRLNGPGHRTYHGDDTRTSRGHGMNTSRSKSRSHFNVREREEQGNMNGLPRSHQSSHVGLPSRLNGPGHRTYHGDDTRTSRGHGMNTSFKGGQRAIKMNSNNNHTASMKMKRPSNRVRRKIAKMKVFKELQEAGTIPHAFNIGCFVRDKDGIIYGIAEILKAEYLIDPLNAVQYVCTIYDVHKNYKKLPLEYVLGKLYSHTDVQLKNFLSRSL